jgi:hypothetical protein
VTDANMAAISGDFLRIDEAPKVFAGEDDPADVASDANTTGDTMAGDPMRGVQPDTSMDFGGTPDDQDAFRAAHGHTSFIDRILHDTDRSRGADRLPPDIAAGIPQKRRPVDVTSFNRAPSKMRTATFALGVSPNGQRAAWDRENRRRIVVTNWDATGPLYVSESQGVAIGSPDAVRVPQAASATVPSSREFFTQGEIWVAGNTGAVFDILDEFDE